MRLNQRCVEGCARLYKDKMLCKACREAYSAPFGMTFNRLAALKATMEKRILAPATPNGVKGSVRAAHKNQTFKYMRVRDRVGINAATPQALINVCMSHATGRVDILRRGYKYPKPSFA